MTQPTQRARNITKILHLVEIVSEKRLMESSIGNAMAKIKMRTPATMTAKFGATIFNSSYILIEIQKRSKAWVQ